MDLAFQETDCKEIHPIRQQPLGEELLRLRNPKCKVQEVEEPRVPSFLQKGRVATWRTQAAEEAWSS